MRLNLIIQSIFIVLLVSCKNKPANPSLWTFGNEKRKFQKVLNYYSKPEDSLKFRAAEFLIENMDEHFYFLPKNDVEVDSFFQNIESQISLPVLSNTKLYNALRGELTNIYISRAISDGSFKIPKYRRHSDVKNISPEYLIENIEYAFKTLDFPWTKSYSFNDFCLYVLPYRYAREAPESWRKDLYKQYKWVADSVENVNDVNEVVSYLNQHFYRILYRSNAMQNLGFKLKMSNHISANVYGSCYEQSGLGVAVLRSLGIPANVISVPKWGRNRFGHDFTAILDSDNKWQYLNFSDLKTKEELNYQTPKMFFKRFDKMKNYQPVLQDFSNELMNVIDMEIEVTTGNGKDIYLCVFTKSSWESVYKTKSVNSKVIFKDIGISHRIYLAAIKSRGKLKPVSPLFSSDSLGNITYYKPNHSNVSSTTYSRKYPFWEDSHIPRLAALIGGEFSVSDEGEFKEKTGVYKIESTLNYYNNIIKCSEEETRYIRYDFPQSPHSYFDGPAEISFFTTQNNTLKKLEGKYFGSPQLSEEHITLMTDNDLLTYVEVWDCQQDIEIETSRFVLRKDKQPIWIGMEMDNPATVTHIGICPRNDKNGIYAGMNYELFYWDDTWNSLGKKVATSDSIEFKGIPENSVLWLRNLDEGVEERIFTMKEGKQIWW